MTPGERLRLALEAADTDVARVASSRPFWAALLLLALIAGIGLGWYLHNRYFRAEDLGYSLQRAVSVSARCKSIDTSEQWRRVEDRIGQPRSFFTIDETLIAIDYVMDRIEVSECLTTGRPH